MEAQIEAPPIGDPPMDASHVEAPPIGSPYQVPDMFWINVALGCFVVVLTWAIYAVHYRFLARPKKILKALRLQGVKGYPFRPFVGQLPELIQERKKRNEDPAYAASTEGFNFLVESAEKYGTMWTYSLGPHPRVVIGDPALVRQVCVQMNDNFPKTDQLQGITLLRDGLLLANGDSWTRQRRLINPAFNHKEMKRMFPTIVACAEEAMNKMVMFARVAPGEALLVDSSWNKMTLDIIARSAFGLQLESTLGTEPMKTVVSAFPEYMGNIVRTIQFSGVVPFFRYLPFELNRKVAKMEKILGGTTRKIVSARIAKHAEERQQQQQQGGDTSQTGQGATDLLELIMNATEGLEPETDARVGGEAASSKGAAAAGASEASGTGAGAGTGTSTSTGSGSGTGTRRGEPGLGKKLSVDQLMGNSMTFLLAGHETTANLLTWTSMLLSQHPEWQEKARGEVNALFEANGGRTPAFEQLSELKIVGWVINESLRLYPPAPLIARAAVKAAKLSDTLTVPAGCDVIIPIALIHRDKALWGEDADRFRPDRFANGIGKAASHPGAFIPFSLGPRTCIGQNFAVAEAKVVIALFLRRFRFSLAPEYRHHSVVGITLRAKEGMPLKLSLLQ